MGQWPVSLKMNGPVLKFMGHYQNSMCQKLQQLFYISTRIDKIKLTDCWVRNCAFLCLANATKTFALAITISQLVAIWRLTILCHGNYTNYNFDFQAKKKKLWWGNRPTWLPYIMYTLLAYSYSHTFFFFVVTYCLKFCLNKHYNYFRGECSFVRCN